MIITATKNYEEYKNYILEKKREKKWLGRRNYRHRSEGIGEYYCQENLLTMNRKHMSSDYRRVRRETGWDTRQWKDYGS